MHMTRNTTKPTFVDVFFCYVGFAYACRQTGMNIRAADSKSSCHKPHHFVHNVDLTGKVASATSSRGWNPSSSRWCGSDHHVVRFPKHTRKHFHDGQLTPVELSGHLPQHQPSAWNSRHPQRRQGTTCQGQPTCKGNGRHLLLEQKRRTKPVTGNPRASCLCQHPQVRTHDIMLAGCMYGGQRNNCNDSSRTCQRSVS